MCVNGLHTSVFDQLWSGSFKYLSAEAKRYGELIVYGTIAFELPVISFYLSRNKADRAFNPISW